MFFFFHSPVDLANKFVFTQFARMPCFCVVSVQMVEEKKTPATEGLHSQMELNNDCFSSNLFFDRANCDREKMFQQFKRKVLSLFLKYFEIWIDEYKKPENSLQSSSCLVAQNSLIVRIVKSPKTFRSMNTPMKWFNALMLYDMRATTK